MYRSRDSFSMQFQRIAPEGQTAVVIINVPFKAQLMADSIYRDSNDPLRGMLSLSNQLGAAPKQKQRRCTFLPG